MSGGGPPYPERGRMPVTLPERSDHFCDRISEAAKVRGMTEETLDKMLSD